MEGKIEVWKAPEGTGECSGDRDRVAGGVKLGVPRGVFVGWKGWAVGVRGHVSPRGAGSRPGWGFGNRVLL